MFFDGARFDTEGARDFGIGVALRGEERALALAHGESRPPDFAEFFRCARAAADEQKRRMARRRSGIVVIAPCKLKVNGPEEENGKEDQENGGDKVSEFDIHSKSEQPF